ncbi:MAG TPA: hypothetical protein VMU27_00040 [Candidatus Paceibacterota bacterium]|nr:hypothetical protein [Candidatus Paceibacterota bacterium]
MNNLTSEQFSELRDALEKERAEVQGELSEHGKKESDGAWDPSSSGLSGEEADPTDTADQIEELVTNAPLVQQLALRVRAIENALLKMKKGTYGFDEETGEAIPFERLRANPAARTVLSHS